MLTRSKPPTHSARPARSAPWASSRTRPTLPASDAPAGGRCRHPAGFRPSSDHRDRIHRETETRPVVAYCMARGGCFSSEACAFRGSVPSDSARPTRLDDFLAGPHPQKSPPRIRRGMRGLLCQCVCLWAPLFFQFVFIGPRYGSTSSTPLIITRGQPWLSTKAEAAGGR